MEELKGGSGLKYRIATYDDYTKWYGGRQKFGAKAYAFFKDEEMVALAGYKLQQNMFIIFSEIKENVILDKLTIFRAAKVVMELSKEINAPKYAVSDNDRLCEALGGFKYMEGEFIWR